MRSTRTRRATRAARNSRKESRAFRWLQETLDLLAHGDSPEEFLEHTRLELFQDQVFCFTPKGGLIALPRGATPIDFAYAVHTKLGDSAVGAKINGRVAPVLSQLQNGDEVEIIRAEGHVPPAAWEARGGDRQGARRHPPRDARGRAPAICRARPADRRARLRARRPRLFGREAEGRADPSRAPLDRRRAGGGRPRRDLFRRRGEGGLSGFHRGAQSRRRRRSRRASRAGSA